MPNGDGGLYLWGNNNDFSGKININSGSFYAMFEENQTSAQQAADPLGQRLSFSANNAAINFGSNTFFRPMMNNNRTALAQLNIAKVTNASNAVLVPYEISRLDPKDYIFNNNYQGFQGFDTPLTELTVNGSTDVRLTIKRELGGYQNLDPSIDIYRKSGLGLIERELLDDIYLTGSVSDEIKDMFEVAGGDDYINYNNVHRATVRQFNRQVNTRLHNRNSENQQSGPGHMWIDTSFNKIRKKQTSKNAGYKYDPHGLAAGYDFEFIPGRLMSGLALSYTTGKVNTLTRSHINSKDDVSNYLLSLYGKYQMPNFYTSWNLGGGYFTNKTHFDAADINTRGKYHSSALFANTETGYNLGGNFFEFKPYIGLEYTYLKTQSFNEKGLGARRFDKTDWNIFETPIGLRLSHDFILDQFIITPAADVAYAHNFGDTSIHTFASVIGGAGGNWRVASDTDNRDSLRGTAALKINHLTQPWALNIGYAIDYRSDYKDQQIFGTLRWDF